jgi:hypothetical protein
MARVQSWEVSDTCWEKVELFIPTPERDPDKTYKRKVAEAESRCHHVRYLKPLLLT